MSLKNIVYCVNVSVCLKYMYFVWVFWGGDGARYASLISESVKSLFGFSSVKGKIEH